MNVLDAVKIMFGDATIGVMIITGVYLFALLASIGTAGNWNFSERHSHFFYAAVEFDGLDQPHLWLFWCATVWDACEPRQQRYFLTRRQAIAWVEAAHRACAATRALEAMGPVKQEPAA